MQTKLSFLRLFSLVALTSVGLFAQACGSSEKAESGEKAPSTLNSSPVISIRIFNDDCEENNFINQVSGKDAVAHLRITGASESSYAIGLIGPTTGAGVDFKAVTLRAPPEGTYAFEIIVRDKTQCAADGESDENCTLKSGFTSEKRSFDASASINFVILSGKPPEQPEKDDKGFFGKIIDTIGSSLAKKLGGSKEPETVPVDPNKGRCAAGIPADVQ